MSTSRKTRTKKSSVIPGVIGQFGIGLKDALAVCDRKGVTRRLGTIASAALSP
jgi:hypothetical protein